MATKELPVPSKIVAVPNRAVNAYSYKWSGVLPATVVRQNETGSYNLHVKGDDSEAAPFHCTTTKGVVLYDPLTDEDRAAIRKAGCMEWAEWMPAQAGAAQPNDMTKRIEALEKAVQGKLVKPSEKELADAKAKAAQQQPLTPAQQSAVAAS